MVIDTMIFAYALLNVENFREEATQVLAVAPRIIVPDSWRAEMANVVWQWTKQRKDSEASAIAVLQDAELLVDQVISSEQIWERALQIALQVDHPVYDTLFIAAAAQLNLKVVTYDQVMLLKFPTQTLSPTDFLP